MKAVLFKNNYGKSAVRILKVNKKNQQHSVTEFTVNVQLEGDFETVHTEGDNRKVLPTDTMKNTVYALAKSREIISIEEFGIYLAKHFLDNNSQLSNVSIRIEEKLWERISVDDIVTKKSVPHNHAFVSSHNEKRTAEIEMDRKQTEIKSGIKDLLVLKTTGSGFENYIKDKYTTLKETSDRIFSTSVLAAWKYEKNNSDFNETYNSVRKIILETFANHHSLSVQQTLFETGKNVIDGLSDIREIFISMPNKHYLLFNLEQFGIENNNEIFIPTDEPFGLIEAVIKRQ